MRKLFLLSSLLITLCFHSFGQGMINNGAFITVTTGAVVSIDGAGGNYLNQTNGTDGYIDLDGTIYVDGNWTNNASGGGTVLTNIEVSPVLMDGLVVFSGAANQNIGGSAPTIFENMELNNAAGATLVNAVNQTVRDVFTLTSGILHTVANKLILTDDATSANTGADDKFVDGWMEKQGNDAFIYPVGIVDGADVVWAPLEIAAPAAASNILVHYYFDPSINNLDPAFMCDPVALDHTSGVEYWMITTTNSTPIITLYWKDAVRSGITDLPNLRVAHYEACLGPLKWVDHGGVGVGSILPGGDGSIVSTVPYTNYSPVTFATRINTNPLPIDLISFDAACSNNNVTVNWTTATETNNDHFTIEKSTNSQDWHLVATVPGAGNSNTQKDYSITVEGDGGQMHYYRLSQTDYNGHKTDYPAIAVSCMSEQGGLGVTVYPNPTKDEIFIEFSNSASGAASVVIYDVLGQRIYTNTISNPGSSKSRIDLSTVASGVYYVEIRTSEYSHTERIVKN